MSERERIRTLLADEDRANIIRKASEDVDNFIANLTKKKYEDGWAEEKWEQEAEKHPLFMSKIDEGQDLPPLVEALQSLKYDPEMNDPVDVAKAHKEDGNEEFKKEKYAFAVAAYSEGLKLKCEDVELNAVLYTNRAAAHYHMGNYKKSLDDAIAAKTLKDTHIKAIQRGALCLYQLGKYDTCISWCKDGLTLNANDQALINLEKKVADSIKKQEDLKLLALEEERKLDFLTNAIKKRGISIADGCLNSESVVCDYAGTSARVQMIDNELVWPVVFLYPQYGISDFIPNFNENSCFYEYFCELFIEYPDWDTKKEYTPDNLKVYFCDGAENIYSVDMKNSLKSTMLHKNFKVTSGSLDFYITSSSFDKFYRAQNNVIEA